uniref:FAD synthase n=1 Tax=Dunaliella tertiolecta TaxID=3047 RepID=A0A7S3R5L5_DUNTE|mmetsp:Transcript_12966/g.34544  ORF Transcript_12966/g.34544 Transcript_12966/m.34544 type:complete len:557 (+) Transcript_12966:1250-2920(+)
MQVTTHCNRSLSLRPVPYASKGHRRKLWAPQKALPSSGRSASARGQLVEECSVDNWRSPLPCDVEEIPESIGVVVALGKFDAMHLGHRALAMKAAEMGGHPMLLSFSGMAEVLKWPARLPLVAPCDRARVLQLWARSCRGRVPRQRMIPFHQIRSMQPEEFVQLLSENLRAAGVVAGCNYRFGFRAQGDAQALTSLGAKYGLQVAIMELVEEGESQASETSRQLEQGSKENSSAAPQVSSSKIRSLLASGAMTSVMQLLGRPYRFVLLLDDASRILSPSNVSNSQQQQQQQHWSPLPVVSFSYPPNLQPQSAPPAQPHPSSSPTSPTTTNCSSDGSVSNTSTSGSSVGSSAGGGTAGVAEASSSGAVERTATDMQDRRRGHLGSSSNPAPGQHAAPCDSRGQAGVQSAEGAGGLQGEGSEDVDTTTRTHPSVPMQVLNQPPGQGLFSCQVALVPCHQQGGAEEFGDREPDGWPGPQTGPGDLPPALASLEEERGQGMDSNALAHQPFSSLHVHIGKDMLSLEPPSGSQPPAAFSKLLGQAQAIGRAPCYLAIDFDG